MTTFAPTAAIDNEMPEQVRPEFHITSDGAADWFLKQLACMDSEIALIKAQADAAINTK